MTIQMLVDAWKVAGADHSVNPPATEAEIQAAEAQIGVRGVTAHGVCLLLLMSTYF